ncbi:hypothetical protein ABPG72_015348 [Tetrahymena utriculariae]
MKMIMKKSPSVSLSSAMILNEEEIQPLQQNEQPKRVFVIGSLRRMREFIEYIKSRQNLHKSSQIDGDDDDEQQHEEKQQCKRGYIGSVSFKYPVKGSKILQLLEESRGFLSKKKVEEDENSNMVEEEEEEEEEEEYDDMVKLYTHSDPYYDLIKLKSSSSSSINSSEQLGRLRNSSSVTSSSSSSNSISSQFIQGNHSSNNNSESVSLLLLQHMELKQQLVEIQRQQMHQNQAQTELMQNLLLAMKEPSYSQNQYKKEQQQQQKQQQQHPEDCSSRRRRIEKEGSGHNSSINTNTSNNNNNKIFERINEMIASEGIFEYPELRKALQRDGYQDQGILTTFVNNKHYIDTLIEIFKPRNVVAVATSSSYQYVQQQQTQTVRQYQQNQQNQLQEIQQHYPSFIQQGHQFTVQDEQQQQQQVIEIEDENENGYKNSSGNGNINANQLAQLNVVQQDDNEINKLSSQTNATKNRERSLSPVYHRQKDAQQKSIDNNKKGYEQKMQKQSYSLSNDPTSKPIRLLKSPNNYSPNNNNKSRSITPQKNLNLNQ